MAFGLGLPVPLAWAGSGSLILRRGRGPFGGVSFLGPVSGGLGWGSSVGSPGYAFVLGAWLRLVWQLCFRPWSVFLGFKGFSLRFLGSLLVLPLIFR